MNLLFFILMLLVFGKILKFAFKAAWGISKIVVTLVLLPIFLIGLVLKGLVLIAIPILVVVGIVSLIKMHD